MSEPTYPRVEYIDPSELDDHPENWKFHPPDQLDTIRRSVERFGYLQPLGTYNARTRRLLNGHARKSLYAGKGVVPIWVVDISEADEAEALATLDATGLTFLPDRGKFEALLSKVPKIDHEATAKLLDSVRKSSVILEPKPEETQQDGQQDRVNLPLDTLWPSDNPLDVPSLLPELQADQIPGPVLQWGSQGQQKPHKGTWHFYAWDAKFEILWKYPDRVLPSGAPVLCEPNFSTIEQTPVWQALHQIGRKRWIARYWQAQGRRILVDLNVSPHLNETRTEFGGLIPNLLGVPKGWRAYSTRAHANQPEYLLAEWELAREHAGTDAPLFLVVGGGKRVKQLAQEHGWLAVDEPVQQALGNRGEAA